MRTLPLLASLALLLAPSCGRSIPVAPSSGAPEGGIRCELIGVEKVTDADWSASFRVENGSPRAFRFQGFGMDSPLFEQEVLEDGEWKPVPVGWCGTGLSEQVLRPGSRMQFTAPVPGDGKSYRFRFGEPALVTPPVAANVR